MSSCDGRTTARSPIRAGAIPSSGVMEKNESKMSAAQRKEEKLELQRQAEEVKLLKVLEKKENAKRVKEEEKKRQEEIRASKEKAAKEARERAQKRKEEEAEARRRDERRGGGQGNEGGGARARGGEQAEERAQAGPHVAIATAEDQKSRFKAANMRRTSTWTPPPRRRTSGCARGKLRDGGRSVQAQRGAPAARPARGHAVAPPRTRRPSRWC